MGCGFSILDLCLAALCGLWVGVLGQLGWGFRVMVG